MFASRFTDKARAWLPLLPLLLLLAATYWLNQQVQPLAPLSSQQRHDIDYAVDNFTAITLNPQGQPRYTGSGEALALPGRRQHASANAQNHQPVCESPAHAHHGADRHDLQQGDDVYLYDDVNILRPASGDIGEQRFVTGYLHVIPDRDWAETNQSIVMTSRHDIIRAVGMELDNKARTVRLLSNVRANHEPLHP